MNLGDLIPQVSYDIIGRVIPGSVMFGTAFLIFQTPEESLGRIRTIFQESGIPSGIILLLCIIVAYMVGALLGGIASATKKRFWERVYVAYPRPKDTIPEGENDDVPFVYDYIQFHRPDIGGRLVKISAERHMCGVIKVGSLILLLLYFWFAPTGLSYFTMVLVSIMLFLMFSAACALDRHLKHRAGELMSNNSALLKADKSLKKTESADSE